MVLFSSRTCAERAYRWGEDGLLGITDRQCRLCFALALWNGRDQILKERLFGLTGPEGNHGEDVKECYFYLDSSPTHSYLSAPPSPRTSRPYSCLSRLAAIAATSLPSKNARETQEPKIPRGPLAPTRSAPHRARTHPNHNPLHHRKVEQDTDCEGTRTGSLYGRFMHSKRETRSYKASRSEAQFSEEGSRY